MTTLAQLVARSLDRKNYIGSTDARIIATGDWMDLYLEKRGEKAAPDLSHVFKVQLGLASEALHLRYWGWQGQEIVHLTRDPMVYRQPDLPEHHGTSLDGWWLAEPIATTNTETAGFPIELKHTHGGNDLRTAAEYYMAQIQWQMHCTGTEGIMFSIICGNADPVRAVVERDQAYIDKLVAQVDLFWECVTEGTPPSFSASAAAVDAAEELTIAAGSVKIDGRKPYDFATNNQWVDVATRYIDEKLASDRFKATDKELRALIPSDAEIVTGGGLQLKRDARGAFRATILDKAS